MMRLVISFCLFLLISASSLHGDEASMNAILKQWDKQMADYTKAIENAPDAAARARFIAPDPALFAKKIWATTSKRTGRRLVERAEATARGEQWRPIRDAQNSGKRPLMYVNTFEYEEPWAAPAVVWWFQYPEALESLFEDERLSRTAYMLTESIKRIHFAHPSIAQACAKMSQSTNVFMFDTLEKIFKHNQSEAARASAALAMSLLLSRPEIQGIEANPELARSKSLYYLRQALLLAPEGMLFGGVDMEEVANEHLYHISKLHAGCTPPQIQVIDQQGTAQKMPQVGQPYLLIFWSPENDVSIDFMHTLSNIKKHYPELKICPITTGMTRIQLIENMRELGLTEQSYLDTTGDAGLAYRVSDLPTVALINHRASLLYFGQPNVSLQTQLDLFFKTYETQQKTATKPATQNRIIIEPSPSPQQESKPAQDDDESVPPLRTMPQF